MDNRLQFSTGYTPPIIKHCIRCNGICDSELYQLCAICREGDRLAAWFDDPEAEEIMDAIQRATLLAENQDVVDWLEENADEDRRAESDFARGN